MEIKAQLLFPSYVWFTSFDDYKDFNIGLVENCYKLREIDSTGVSKSNDTGWQSSPVLQELEQFEELNQRILLLCKSIGESLQFLPNSKYTYQAWVNISPPGAFNKVHHHPNSHFSGVYYVSLKAPECGRIYFRDPRIAGKMLTYPASSKVEFTSEETIMSPEEGRVYIFPSWLEHGVEVNRSQQDRISISFNVFASV